MDNERDLKGPDFSGKGIGYATQAMHQSAKGGPSWLRTTVLVFAGMIAVVSVAGFAGKLFTMGSLPACDAQRTRDTLSDLNKQNKVNAASYNFIKTVSATDTEILCTANLALRDGGTLEYDYRVFKDASGIRVQITDGRRPPSAR